MLYAYNTTTGEYSMTLPFENKVEDGFTDIEPPKTKEQEVAVFDRESNKWNVFPDFRFTHKMLKDNEVFPVDNFGEIPSEYELITLARAEEIEKQKKIETLTMTPLDFINVLVACGLTLEQINAFLDSNLAIKTQLTFCNLVYCGVAKSLMPLTFDEITITSKMVEEAFVEKNKDLFVVEENPDEQIEY